MKLATLVVGATGSFGAAVVRELLDRGARVHALSPDCDTAADPMEPHARLRKFRGDAQHYGDVMRASEGCSHIVHAMKLPLHRWFPELETAMKIIIATATKREATVLWPDNLLAYGKQTHFPLDETSPPLPCSEKGELRLRLECDLRSAVDDGQIRAIVLRSGEAFGPTVRNPVVNTLFGHAANGRPMLSMMRTSVARQWAYLPDLAAVAADLLERESDLDPFEIVHFEGHTARPHREFCRAVAHAAGKPRLLALRYPWLAIRLRGLIDADTRALGEIRYSFEEPVLLRGKRFETLFPDHRTTPLDQALEATVASYVNT